MGEIEIYRSSELIAARGVHVARTRYRVVTPGIRMPVGDGDPPEFEERAAAILELNRDAVLGGWSAARLYRHTMAESRNFVEINCPRIIHRRNVVCRAGRREPYEETEVDGFRCTTAVRTAIDLARYTPGDEAIAAMDQCLRVHRFGRPAIATRAAIESELDAREWWRGKRVRDVLAESDGRSESPWETFARLTLHRAGLGMFVPQVPELDGTYWVNLGHRASLVGIEYDGAGHLSAKQKAADETRRNNLQDAGWHLIVATAPLIRNKTELVRLAVNALRQRGFDPFP